MGVTAVVVIAVGVVEMTGSAILPASTGVETGKK
jgi:hypothetical protein